MKVICRAHKDSLLLVISLGIIVCILPIVLAILLHDHKYIMLVFIVMSVVFILVFVLIIIREAFTKNDIVIFDEGEKKFVVNRYLKKYCFTVPDISDFKYDNKGMGSFGPLIFFEEEEFGSLIFILKKGEKIRTPLIDNVLEKYNEIKIIIDGDNK